MSSGSQDWIRRNQIVVMVESVPMPQDPTVEAAAGAKGQYSGVDQTYQEVCSWTVAASKVGDLKEILIISDEYDHTVLQITIGAVTWCTGWTPQRSMPLIFEDLKLAAGVEVKVEAKSDDGTAIKVDGVITAKEIG